MDTSSNSDDLATPAPQFPRILCAEDNQHYRASLALLFATAKLSVVFASDGQHALDLLAAQPGAFDLLITDHQMPRLDGLALVRHLRQSAFPGHIVVFSSSLQPQDRAAYHALRVDDMLTKPDHGLDLLKIVEQLSYRHHHP
jgi:CheY-like chemotaxis protein